MTDLCWQLQQAFHECAVGDWFVSRTENWSRKPLLLFKVNEGECWWAFTREDMEHETCGEGWKFSHELIPSYYNITIRRKVADFSEDEIWE